MALWPPVGILHGYFALSDVYMVVLTVNVYHIVPCALAYPCIGAICC